MTTTVHGKVLSPGLSAATDSTIQIETYAVVGGGAGFASISSDEVELIGRTQVTPANDGTWSVVLRGNPAVSPANTVYSALYLRDGYPPVKVYFTCPDDGANHWIGSLLVDPPGSLPSSALADHINSTTAHTAAHITVNPAGLTHITSTNVQGALGQLDTAIGGGGGGGTASGTTFSPNAAFPYYLVSTDVQAAILELKSRMVLTLADFGAMGTYVDGEGTKVRNAIITCHTHGYSLRAQAGHYKMTDTGGAAVRIDGASFDFGVTRGQFEFFGDGEDTVNLEWPVNLGFDTTSPNGDALGNQVSYDAIEPWNCNQTNKGLFIHNMTLTGPSATTDSLTQAEARDRGNGLLMAGRCVAWQVRIVNFHSGFHYRTNSVGAGGINTDHNFNLSCTTDSNWYGAYWQDYHKQSGVNTGNGDQTIEGFLNSNNAKASLACDASGNIFDSRITSGHFGTCPYVIYREAGFKQTSWTLPATATVSRDTFGTVTLDTKTSGGLTDFPGHPMPPANGILIGTLLDLNGLLVGGAYPNIETGTKGVGLVTAVTSTGVLTITMEAPRTGSVLSVVALDSTSTVSPHYNILSWMDNVFFEDTTFEGGGVSEMFCEYGDSTIARLRGTQQWHGLEVIGRNGGGRQCESRIGLTYVKRDYTGGSADGTTGAIYTVTVKMFGGQKFQVGDFIFNDTYAPGELTAGVIDGKDQQYTGTFTNGTNSMTAITTAVNALWLTLGYKILLPGDNTPRTITATTANSITWSGAAYTGSTGSGKIGIIVTGDDNPPKSGWSPNSTRVRGKYQVLTMTDNADVSDPVGCVLTYAQVYGSKNHYATTTALGDSATLGSAGRIGRVVAVWAGWLDSWSGIIDSQAESQSGTGTPEWEFGITKITGMRVHMHQGNLPIIRKQKSATVVSQLVPINSLFTAGALEGRVSTTIEAIFQGAVLEFNNKDRRLFRGGSVVAGVAMYAANANDYCISSTTGPSTAKDYGGVFSVSALAANNIAAADTVNPGFVKLASAGDTIVGHISAASTASGANWQSSINIHCTPGSGSGTPADRVVTPVLSGSNFVCDWSLGDTFIINLTASGQVIQNTNVYATTKTIIVKQDGTGGRTWTWAVAKKWPDGIVPTPVTGASAIEVYQIWYDGASQYASRVGKNFA